MGLAAANIYETEVKSGLALAWVNSYSAVAVKSPGATVLVDPVSMDIPEHSRLDLIAVSHGHSDHWDPGLVKRLRHLTGARVAASPTLAARLERDAVFEVTALSPGQSISAGDMTVHATRCDHAAPEPLSFIVTTAGGLTVYLPGDTTPFPEMAQPLPNGAGPVDILFWTGTSLTDGAEIARLVSPRIFLTYAINPPAAGERAMGILNFKAPDTDFRALQRHEVFTC